MLAVLILFFLKMFGLCRESPSDTTSGTTSQLASLIQKKYFQLKIKFLLVGVIKFMALNDSCSTKPRHFLSKLLPQEREAVE